MVPVTVNVGTSAVASAAKPTQTRSSKNTNPLLRRLFTAIPPLCKLIVPSVCNREELPIKTESVRTRTTAQTSEQRRDRSSPPDNHIPPGPGLQDAVPTASCRSPAAAFLQPSRLQTRAARSDPL